MCVSWYVVPRTSSFFSCFHSLAVGDYPSSLDAITFATHISQYVESLRYADTGRPLLGQTAQATRTTTGVDLRATVFRRACFILTVGSEFATVCL